MKGAQNLSGDWIVPMGPYKNIYFTQFENRGKTYAYFSASKSINDDKFENLVTLSGEELVPHGRYGMFFWSESEGRMLGTGPNGYETININLSKLLLPSPQVDLNQLLIGSSWENIVTDIDLRLYKDFDFFAYILFSGVPIASIDGKWAISGQYIIFKSDETKIDEKYSVKVLSPSEIELIPIKGSKTFRGKYRKNQ